MDVGHYAFIMYLLHEMGVHVMKYQVTLHLFQFVCFVLCVCMHRYSNFTFLFCGRASEVHVYNAKTMSSEPVAVVKLPARVPYGFHALFVNEVGKQLKFQ
jgi:hypothetical protein